MKPDAYGPFPYSPIIDRPKLCWPEGAHVALWVIPNVEFFALNEIVPAATGTGGASMPVPDIPSWSVRDYGNRIGIFRIMDVLDRHGIRATAALNSDLCGRHPRIIEEGNRRGWEWMGHNESNSRRLNAIEPSQERSVIRNCLSTIEQASGRRPTGWLSSALQETWNTLDILANEGCEYVSDWVNDDQPYLMELESGKTLVSIPYSHVINDKPQYERDHRSADEFQAMICRQFDVLYREGADSGRVMAISIHPYLTGMPHRIGALAGALDYISRHANVWMATGSEIVAHYRGQFQTA
ncbi:MAG: polysaccharide deacetylase family protein [Hyphomicrobiales bacterium]|nr:polysaccharide deacetylase family protein [Hyphomicrobiales bacterium]